MGKEHVVQQQKIIFFPSEDDGMPVIEITETTDNLVPNTCPVSISRDKWKVFLIEELQYIGIT